MKDGVSMNYELKEMSLNLMNEEIVNVNVKV